MPRYMIERTFPAGALEGLDEKAKRAVNIKNAGLGRHLDPFLRQRRQDQDVLCL